MDPRGGVHNVDSTKIFDPAKQNVDSSVDQPVAYYTD
jgi:hypothetical protein